MNTVVFWTIFHGPCLAAALAAGEPGWPQEQQGDGLAGYQQSICDSRDLENGCYLNAAWRVKLPLQTMLRNVPMDASKMSSWEVILQSGAGGKLLAWGWEREGSTDRGGSPCQELAERSQPGNLYEPKCSHNQLLLWQETVAQGCAPALNWFPPIVLWKAPRIPLLNQISSWRRSSYHILVELLSHPYGVTNSEIIALLAGTVKKW